MTFDPVKFRSLPAWKQEGYANIMGFVAELPVCKIRLFRDNYRYAILTSGRAFGKTTLQSAWIAYKMLENPGSKGLLIGKTYREVVANNIESQETGLFRFFPFIPRQSAYAKDKMWNAQKQEIRLPNGSSLRYLGSAESNTTRGYNFAYCAVDEFAYLRNGVNLWNEITLTSRTKIQQEGGRVQVVACSTPARNSITKLVYEHIDDSNSIHIHGSMLDNIKNLDPEWILEKIKIADTPMGKLEVLGLLNEVPNALATPEMIDACRFTAEPNSFDHLILSVDPAIEADDRGSGSHTGIVLIGKRGDVYYVLNDYTRATHAKEWADLCVSVAYDKDCAILVETNQGGELTKGFIQQAAQMKGMNVRVASVKATKSKEARAEIAAQVLEQGRLCFPKSELPELEAQFCAMSREDEYRNKDKGHRDDRVDALSQAVNYMKNFKEAAFS